jgi:hypothetical protein
MPITFSPSTLQGLMKAVKESGSFLPEEQKLALESVKNFILNKPGQTVEQLQGMKGAAPAVAGAGLMGLLPLLGAGALATAAWAYPAKKLGETLGWKIESKKAGRNLQDPAFDEATSEKMLAAIKKRRNKKIK